MIRILIGDEHILMREGLKLILAQTQDIAVTGEARNGAEVLDKISENQYDVILSEIALPKRTGIEIVRELKAREISIPVLILTMYSEEQYAVRALKAGASGFMTKDTPPSQLAEAIRIVSQGRKYIHPSLAEKLADVLEAGNNSEDYHKLSDREYQVMCLIASGKTIKETAEMLHLGVKTISTYRSRILEKLNLKTNAAMTHYAVHKRLVNTHE